MRTVRSAAWSRNRPRCRLAWLIILVLLALIALAARVDAAPGAHPTDLAIRHAGALTDADAAGASVTDGDEDDEEASEAETERASVRDDDRGDDGDDGDDADAARRDPAGLAGELGEIDRARGDAVDDDPLAEPDEANAASLAVTTDGLDALLADAGSGTLAMLDAELDPGDPIAGVDAADAAAPAGAAEIYEQSLRRLRPSRWGRLDAGVAWRSRWSEPMHAPPHHTSEIWLVATWRR